MSILKRILQKLKPGPKEISPQQMGKKINQLQARAGIREEQMPEMFQDFGEEKKDRKR